MNAPNFRLFAPWPSQGRLEVCTRRGRSLSGFFIHVKKKSSASPPRLRGSPENQDQPAHPDVAAPPRPVGATLARSSWAAGVRSLPLQRASQILSCTDAQRKIGHNSHPALEARRNPELSRRVAGHPQVERQIIRDGPVIFLGHGLSNMLVKPCILGRVWRPILVPLERYCAPSPKALVCSEVGIF